MYRTSPTICFDFTMNNRPEARCCFITLVRLRVQHCDKVFFADYFISFLFIRWRPGNSRDSVREKIVALFLSE